VRIEAANRYPNFIEACIDVAVRAHEHESDSGIMVQHLVENAPRWPGAPEALGARADYRGLSIATTDHQFRLSGPATSASEDPRLGVSTARTYEVVESAYVVACAGQLKMLPINTGTIEPHRVSPKTDAPREDTEPAARRVKYIPLHTQPNYAGRLISILDRTASVSRRRRTCRSM
jgi:hypothetical protein